jgi:SagB-type dehydrogenase family enzyme
MKKNIRTLLINIQGKLSLAEQFHKNTSIKKLFISSPGKEMPDSYKTIHYKTYPRLKAFTLDKKKNRSSNLTNIINKRISTREFSGKPITFETFFHLIKDSAGINRIGNNIQVESRRAYPSAGARYALEIYAVILHVKGLKNGLYHYNVKHNVIELLHEKKDIWSEVNNFFDEKPLKNAAVLFIITGVLNRLYFKYGDRGYRHMLIESGHLAQNLCLLATDYGLGVCTYGGFIEDKLIEFLDIKLQKELPLYIIAVGQKKLL